MASIKALSVKSRTIGSNIDEAELEKLMTHKLLAQKQDNSHIDLQIYYHHIWARYHLLMPNSEKAYKHQKKVMDLFWDQKKKVLDSPRWWIQNARVMLIILGSFRYFDEFDSTMKEYTTFIDTIPANTRTINHKSEIYTTIYSIKLDIDIDRGRFDEAANFAEEVESGIQNFKYQVNPGSEIVLYYNMCYVYFGSGNYKKALHWLNRVLNTNFRDVRIDIQCHARLINLLVHYELKHFDLMPVIVRSAGRFLRGKKRLFTYEKAFIDYAKNHLSDTDNPKFIAGTSAALEKFKELSTTDEGENALHYFDMICWMKSKLSGIPMAKFMAEKVHAQKPD